MNILILGGTVFLGRWITNVALERDHCVTLLNRGKSNPGLFPEVETIQADRTRNLDALKSRCWDAAIDTSGYVPRVVRSSAELLAEAVRHYTFISSLSVYDDTTGHALDENAPLAKMADETVEEVTGETYGPLKALCEQAAEECLPGRVLTVRPGLIVGPHDPTDRFTYWPYRVAQGGEVLAPGRPQRPVQYIDVRDLAEWIVRMVEGRQTGRYNAISPPGTWTMGDLLGACQKASGSDAKLTWVDEAFLAERGVQPWGELPAWVPENDPEMKRFFDFEAARSLEQGLTIRPLEDTVKATLDWLPERGDKPWRAGLTLEKERQLLEEWHKM